MGWRGFDAFIFSAGVVITLALFVYDFSDAVRTMLMSIVFGIAAFILFVSVSGMMHDIFNNDKKLNNSYEDRLRVRRKHHRIGIIILILVIIAFLNSYLYFKALIGNDMLISLKIDDKNIFLKNGEIGEVNVKAKILTNPFCQVNCSLIMEDLSKDKTIDYESFYLKFSSPLSKDYLLYMDEGTSGINFYRAKLECNTTKTLLCYVASENTKTRAEIISVNHELNDLQKMRQEDLKNRAEDISNEFYITQNGLKDMNFDFYFLDLSYLKNEASELNSISYNISDNVNNLDDLYNNQEYYEMEQELYLVEKEFEGYNNRYDLLNLSFYNTANSYNTLVHNMTVLYNESSYLEDYNYTNLSVKLVESYINNFNFVVDEMKDYATIEEKTVLFSNLQEDRNSLLSVLVNDSLMNVTGENPVGVSIYPVDLLLINFTEEEHFSNITLSEPPPICCLKNECYVCIDDSSVNYPIILVHGHSFNEKISAEASMEAFSDLSDRLEEDGYVDAGDFYGIQYDESLEGYLGKINNSVVLKTTYYIDTVLEDEGSFILESKGDNIDIYADRLNEIVSNIKYLTGKDKVIIVAHSMGGLVTRRYIQKYGDDSVDKLILVGIPNKGVDGRVASSCPIFGADAECADLNSNSLFIADLNRAPLPSIPVYNIIGLGCIWEDSYGDGIVKNKSAYLEGANNIYVNGLCGGISFFHVDLIKPSKYPEVYEIVKEILNS
jgi:hypothetical protein